MNFFVFAFKFFYFRSALLEVPGIFFFCKLVSEFFGHRSSLTAIIKLFLYFDIPQTKIRANVSLSVQVSPLFDIMYSYFEFAMKAATIVKKAGKLTELGGKVHIGQF